MFEQDFTSDIIWVSSILFPDLSKQWASNEVLSMVSYTGLPFRADTDIHEVELGGSDSGKNEQERQIQDACKADITWHIGHFCYYNTTEQQLWD